MTREPLILDRHPGALTKRLCIVLERHDRKYVVYPRQETPMEARPAFTPAEKLDVLAPSLEQLLIELQAALARAQERAQQVADLLDLMTEAS